MKRRLKRWWQRLTDPNARLPWCARCPDHEACSQGACYLDGGPNRG